MNVHVNPLRYTFVPVTNCDMCGDSAELHRTLGQRLNKSQGFNPKSKSGISVSVKRCKNCGLIYSDPQPRPYSINDHYGIPPESYWSSDYFQWDESYFQKYIDKAKKIINFQSGMKALDIGSGTGKILLSLSNAGFDTYGVEPSEPFRERALEFTKIPSEKLQLSSVEEVDFPENEFDFIVINAVAEHVFSPSVIILKALKWIKPGGVILVSVPSADYLVTNIIDAYFKVIGTLYTSHISPMHEPFHLFEFTLKSFEENGKRLGYKIADSFFDVCPIPFFPKILHPVLRKYMEITKTGMDLDVWIQK